MEQQLKQDALFLPFMQIPTGHHHVADALMEDLMSYMDTVRCNKIDILSYSYGKMETVVSSTYLRWIKNLPNAYHWIYDQMAYKKADKRNRNYLYELLFINFFKRLLKEHEPRILFCTHALPSNIASVLKQKGKLQATIVNVYTDYFVNRVWGIEGVDYHFVPSVEVKKFLQKLGVDEKRIYVTGIPVHREFNNTTQMKEKNPNELQVLVTGGSLGVGGLEKILSEPSEAMHYYVLCGKNTSLYKQLKATNRMDVTPIPYIERKQEMNAYYNQVDAVITKPGGVTISECLIKRKPIFVCNALPGQEKINEQQLKRLGVVQPVTCESAKDEIKAFFSDVDKQKGYHRTVDHYHQQLENRSMVEILEEIFPFA
ncbi:UDP-N-acetylglucosamine:LPS N-acetylglucosamine transferase [Oceanobacillus limi]|uniref:UDP-N-acetylglucosamine:LPS N-acetylglucosamine transferase n=2 Tax=Oceanobacillus limi TaxID=930131 RepID=A0A1I0BSK6_9BACI|nr:UDP-N-acetylglucosamine:LPS N-acetylglucosamine transferase [Oceanobacillus limi]